MKLAIIISGMLRNFDHTYIMTEKFVLNDPFFELKHIFFAGYSGSLNLEEAEEKFVNLYKPKKYIIENWGEDIRKSIVEKTGCDSWKRTLNHTGNITNVMSAWRCRYLANQLRLDFEKLNNIKYDLVYNLRSDLFFFDQIDHNIAKDSLKNKNSVYVPPDWDFKSLSPKAIGDIMALGSSDAMNKYFSLYLHANSYRMQGVHDHPETIMGYHFKAQNIDRKFCDRNVAREYPYSDPKGYHLWESNWRKEDVLTAMNIDEKFLLGKRPKRRVNAILNVIIKFKSLIKKLLNLLNKYL